ncbi:hypothetical protein PUN28_019098 [Cardiocondyla obscurior]|uniref:Uncharacterized protein n=1 Tax=Cardiocondyla obscurior TaxID=286306 RepID=A0AAW2EG17_9HYME
MYTKFLLNNSVALLFIEDNLKKLFLSSCVSCSKVLLFKKMRYLKIKYVHT